jgi:tyrosine-protein kinase
VTVGAQSNGTMESNGNGRSPTSAARLRPEENELHRVLGMLRRRAIPILLCVVLVAAASVTLALLQDKQYTASASLLFREQTLAQELPGSTSPAVDAQAQAETNIQLASLQQLAARTAEELGPKFDPREISDNVKVAAKGTSSVVDVTAQWRSPTTAALVATEFARQFVRFEADSERARIRVAQRRVRLTLSRELESAAPNQARVAALQHKLDDLEVLKSVSSGQAQLVQRADVPTTPSSPRPKRSALIGIFAGLLLGLGIAIGLEQLDRRVRSSAEFEELLGVPVLAQIPESDGFSAAARVPIPEPPIETEFFNILGTTIQRLDHGSGVSSVLITSPTPEVGKTTVALNLALAAARSGTSTLLLEVDLRRPAVAERLGVASDPNLAQALNSGLPLADVVQSVPIPSPDSPEEIEAQLDVVVAGDQNRDAPRLIESEEMERIIDEAESTYDLVIVDAPPAGLISDAVALLSLVEGTMIVCRLSQTTRDQVLWLRSQLDQVNANVMGVVSNFAPVKVDDYYGAYRWQATQAAAPAVERNGKKAEDRVA